MNGTVGSSRQPATGSASEGSTLVAVARWSADGAPGRPPRRTDGRTACGDRHGVVGTGGVAAVSLPEPNGEPDAEEQSPARGVAGGGDEERSERTPPFPSETRASTEVPTKSGQSPTCNSGDLWLHRYKDVYFNQREFGDPGSFWCELIVKEKLFAFTLCQPKGILTDLESMLEVPFSSCYCKG